jgi:hypothetical protein
MILVDARAAQVRAIKASWWKGTIEASYATKRKFDRVIKIVQ